MNQKTGDATDFSVDGEKPTRRIRLEAQATETIDFSQVYGDALTESGSFAVLGISSTATGSLLNALPIPVLCIDSSLCIGFANHACSKIVPDSEALKGNSIASIIPRPHDIDLVRSVTEAVFSTRKPQVLEAMIRTEQAFMWGRIHLRSLRILGEQLVLVLVEDLTPEKRRLILQNRHEKELEKTRRELEYRVREATLELSRVNEGLRKEIAYRRRAQQELKESLVKFKKTLDGTITALASLAEKRDPYTAGHQLRVARLACAIAKRMGLAADRVKGIGIAASMHDIGKICVPAELLSKPGRISEHEYGIIKAHPEVGYDILKVIDFPWPLAEIALQHHERIDGTGYPRGLEGREMLLESRIIAVADVVEAISSHRPYRPSLGLKHAVREIVDNRGILYDTDVVNSCLAIFQRVGTSREPDSLAFSKECPR
jgi:HD-GYP domain-containing protein (c-di-GMP phosphodiesterase class II)